MVNLLPTPNSLLGRKPLKIISRFRTEVGGRQL